MVVPRFSIQSLLDLEQFGTFCFFVDKNNNCKVSGNIYINSFLYTEYGPKQTDFTVFQVCMSLLDCPVKHQGRASNQKRESRLQSPNGNSQPQRTTSNGADAPLPRASYGVSRPTHRRGLSEGNWRQARLTTLGSTKFQLNPNALPFQKVSMNPDAAPFIPPDTIHACARSLSKGL